MSNRRSLIDGIRPAPTPTPPVDPKKEVEFVYGSTKPATQTTDTVTPGISQTNRVPLTTRIRSDMFEALKRASLQRQLNKVEPNTVQDILETALEPWLKQNGFL